MTKMNVFIPWTAQFASVPSYGTAYAIVDRLNELLQYRNIRLSTVLDAFGIPATKKDDQMIVALSGLTEFDLSTEEIDNEFCVRLCVEKA